MKVVLFCGGQGQRLRDVSKEGTYLLKRAADAPKPMQLVGGQPILWHLMKWYAWHGHCDFVLCVGFRAEVVRSWVMGLSDRVVSEPSAVPGVPTHHFQAGDAQDWRVTVVDSGLDANIGDRLRAVREIVADEDYFLANYADGLSDVPLQSMIDEADASGAVATLLAVPPPESLHAVELSAGSTKVDRIAPMANQGVLINAGFFVLRPAVFDVMKPGDELVEAPFARLAGAGRLHAYPYKGFWRAMDTAKDRMVLEDLWYTDSRPWAVWEDAT
ncbi:MAG: glucose-1-phosphate cytidylyltransferase [Frankia sp.]